MGFRDLLLLYVVAALSIRWIATAAAAGPSSILMWVVGCVTYFVPLVFCVLELSSRYPEEGGMYVWSKRAFGEFAGFMTGWLYWAATLPYFPAILYFAAANALFIRGDRWQHLANNNVYFIVFSLAGLLVGVTLNILGLDFGKWLHNVGAIGAWLPAFMLIVLGSMAWLRFGSATQMSTSTLLPSVNLKTLFFWSTIAFALGGAEGMSAMGEEIQNPRRNIPRAVVASGIIITITYIAGTAVVLAALPSNEVTQLQGFIQAITKVGDRVGFYAAGPVAALLVTIGSIGGGGRYDDLTGLFGVPNIPGVGISFGVDRMYDVMEELRLFPDEVHTGTQVLFFNLGEKESKTAFESMQQLRANNIRCELYHEAAKFDKEFR